MPVLGTGATGTTSYPMCCQAIDAVCVACRVTGLRLAVRVGPPAAPSHDWPVQGAVPAGAASRRNWPAGTVHAAVLAFPAASTSAEPTRVGVIGTDSVAAAVL